MRRRTRGGGVLVSRPDGTVYEVEQDNEVNQEEEGYYDVNASDNGLVDDNGDPLDRIGHAQGAVEAGPPGASSPAAAAAPVMQTEKDSFTKISERKG